MKVHNYSTRSCSLTKIRKKRTKKLLLIANLGLDAENFAADMKVWSVLPL